MKTKYDNDLTVFSEEYFGIKPGQYEIGTGSLVTYQGKYLFVIQNKTRWIKANESIEAGVVGLGGKLEEGESIFECLERECLEELGTGITIKSSKTTYLIKGESTEKHDSQTIGVYPAPLMVMCLKNRERGRKPFSVVYSYVCDLIGVPEPIDVCAIFLASKTTLKKLDSGDFALSDSIGHGAEIIEKEPLPGKLRLRPYGTFSAFIKLTKID